MEKEKRKTKDDKEQSKRFVETAKSLDADETEEGFERAIESIAKDKKTRDKQLSSK